MQVWNRKELIEVPEVGLGAIRFTYNTAFGRILAKGILCRKFVSNIYGAWQKSRLSRGKVNKFIKQYHIDVSDCTKQHFDNFNDFFTRQRKRYVDQTGEGELPAIADSKLLAMPIDENSRFEIKGVPYTVEELLENSELAKKFLGGYCLIFRLAPDDYHRYVYPDGGSREQSVLIKGVLHTVNPIAADMKVYRRNTRCYQLLHTAHFGDVLQIEVGALLVGKICNHLDAPGKMEKLQEKGYFAYGGSTVILLLQKDRVQMDADILEHSARGIETKIHLGEKIGIALP
ncbi:MAG: phosphatidylserine decarboxylase [Oscillospiraceae bacterium]|nr:phosphatidylserine decarboxylase [Oscillospiraceae bacterium]